MNEDILLTTLVKALPKQLQQHIQLNLSETSTYGEIKEKVIAYERLNTTWSREKKFTASLVLLRRMQLTAVVQPQWKSTRSRASPKAKDRKGNHRKEKAKIKEPRKAAKARANHSRAGKGYGSPSKGGGKAQSKTADVNRCNYCGAHGHWKKDCRKFQADKASGAVRQVEGDDNASQRVASSPSSTGTVQHSPSATSYRSTGNVNRVAFSDSTVIIEDLTEYPEPGSFSSGLVRMIQQHSHALQFDMSCTDDDDHWTCSPDVQMRSLKRFHHVRMMSLAGSGTADIILDSGADTSALPLSYINVGE